jgi:hypothetical protein
MIQLTDCDGRLKVAASNRVPLPDGVKGDPDRRVAFAGEQLRIALKRGAFRGNRVVASLPKELLHYKRHRLPPIAAVDVAASARIDARDLFPFDPNSVDVQVLDAGEIHDDGSDGNRRREVILIAAGKKYVDQFTLALDAAGAEVVSLDVDPCSLWRAAQRVPLPAGLAGLVHPRVLLDVGAAQSRIVIGLDDIRVIDTIAATADSPGVLAREALKAVRYHAATFSGPSPQGIELLGGSAHDPELRSTLASTLLLPTRPAELFADIDATSIPETDRTPSLGEWAVVLGLIMRGSSVRSTLSAPVLTGGAA